MADDWLTRRERTCVCGPEDHFRTDHHSMTHLYTDRPDLLFAGVRGGCRITGCPCPEFRDAPAARTTEGRE